MWGMLYEGVHVGMLYEGTNRSIIECTQLHNFMQRFGLIGPVLHCSVRHWSALVSNECHLSCLVPD